MTKIVLQMNEITGFSSVHIFCTPDLGEPVSFCGQQMLLIGDTSFLLEI